MSDGFTQAADTMHEPSVTKTFGASHTWLCELSTDVFGSRPMRAVPISWMPMPGEVAVVVDVARSSRRAPRASRPCRPSCRVRIRRSFSPVAQSILSTGSPHLSFFVVSIDDRVRVVRQHLAERGGADRPRRPASPSSSLNCAADAELRDRARPALAARAALVAEAAQVVALVAEQVAVARDVEAGRPAAVVVLVVQPLERAARRRARKWWSIRLWPSSPELLPSPPGHTSVAERMSSHVELSVDAQRKMTFAVVVGDLRRSTASSTRTPVARLRVLVVEHFAHDRERLERQACPSSPRRAASTTAC